MTIVTQNFNPPLKVCLGNERYYTEIESRQWETEDKSNFAARTQNLGYIGNRQIEEVWKHYHKEYYISNYGYIVKIAKEDAQIADIILPGILKNADENSSGVRWLDFLEEVKLLFRRNAFVPKNRENSGCQICLNITGKTPKYDIHKLVARFFLKKPEDYDQYDYVVHHIDNNSYNNSVTNLIYLKAETHKGNQHKIYHPMSHTGKKIKMKKIVLDTETTGFYPLKGDKIVEIGALELDEDDCPTGQTFHTYINPECEVSEEAVKIHGLTNKFLKDYPTFGEIKDEFLRFIEGKALIAHNLSFDLGFLEHELGFNLPNKMIDTLEMVKKSFPDTVCSLDALCKIFKINPKAKNAQGTLLDVMCLAEVYQNLPK